MKLRVGDLEECWRAIYKNEGGRQADGKRRQRNLNTEDVTVSSKCEKNIYILPGD